MWDEDLRFGGFDSNVILEAWIVNLGLKNKLLEHHHSSILRRVLGCFQIQVWMIFIQ